MYGIVYEGRMCLFTPQIGGVDLPAQITPNLGVLSA